MTSLQSLVESMQREADVLHAHEIIVDSFAGGGGASLGIEMALGRSPDIAINHDAEVIALHAANHPTTKHYQENVWQVDPMEATQGRPVGLMWLSPDCKHFSKAKGGKPVSKKVRGLAWVATRWAKAVRPRVIVLENVEEFQSWGPLLSDGKPCPDRKGHTFRRFIRRLERLGYAVQWRELRACDYGAPTIRRRLFLVARCDGQPIVWPTPTHGKGTPRTWRTAAECIDWSIPCPSIFTRTRPLADNTLRRVAAGLRKFVIETGRPFIVPIQNTGWGDRCTGLDTPDVIRLADAMPEPHRALCLILAATGMDLSTALAVRVRDVDGDTIHARGTKSVSRDRIVTVATFARFALAGAVRGKLPDALLFDGIPSRWNASDLHRDTVTALVAEGHAVFDGYWLRDHRHTCAVRLVRAGVPFAHVAAQLGHANEALVAKVYGRFLPDAAERKRWESQAVSAEKRRSKKA